LIQVTNILNINNWSGGSSKVTGVYLYDHELFKKNIRLDSYHFLRNFNLSFVENVINSPELEYMSSKIDFSQFKNKNIVIYLSGWTISTKINTLLEKYPEHYKILKVHPHIVSVPKHITEIFDFTIPTSFLFEYFLFKVVEFSIATHIIHHGSFALHYLDDFKTNNVTQEIIMDNKK
jgi:hypothetical protein